MPTYTDAGVDLEKADRLVDRLAAYQKQTEEGTRRQLFQGFGDFAAGYDLEAYDHPVILTTCDGVGTKFLLQQQHNELESAGRDLVAMNVNDLLTRGADPLLFLDYVAMSPLDESTVETIVRGMAEACLESNCLLAGGETAELPGMLEEGEVELAGFCVGAAEKDALQQPPPVQAGQVVLGLPSRGFHANGFSLVRTVLDQNPDRFSSQDIQELLVPTRLYHEVVQTLREAELTPSAMAHVTGGGIAGNLSRVLPDQMGATLEIPEWNQPTVREILEFIPDEEAVKTFNMGFGWLLVVPDNQVRRYRDLFDEIKKLGEIVDGQSISIRYRGEPV